MPAPATVDTIKAVEAAVVTLRTVRPVFDASDIRRMTMLSTRLELGLRDAPDWDGVEKMALQIAAYAVRVVEEGKKLRL